MITPECVVRMFPQQNMPQGQGVAVMDTSVLTSGQNPMVTATTGPGSVVSNQPMMSTQNPSQGPVSYLLLYLTLLTKHHCIQRCQASLNGHAVYLPIFLCISFFCHSEFVLANQNLTTRLLNSVCTCSCV